MISLKTISRENLMNDIIEILTNNYLKSIKEDSPFLSEFMNENNLEESIKIKAREKFELEIPLINGFNLFFSNIQIQQIIFKENNEISGISLFDNGSFINLKAIIKEKNSKKTFYPTMFLSNDIEFDTYPVMLFPSTDTSCHFLLDGRADYPYFRFNDEFTKEKTYEIKIIIKEYYKCIYDDLKLKDKIVELKLHAIMNSCTIISEFYNVLIDYNLLSNFKHQDVLNIDLNNLNTNILESISMLELKSDYSVVNEIIKIRKHIKKSELLVNKRGATLNDLDNLYNSFYE